MRPTRTAIGRIQIWMLCVFSGIFSSGYSQGDSTLLENRKVVVGIEGFSQLCSRTFSSPDNMTVVPGSSAGFFYAWMFGSYHESYDASHDRPAIGFGGHLNINIRMTRHLRMKIGVGAEQFRLKTKKMEVYARTYDTYSQTYYVDTLGTNWQFNFNYTLFSVPLTVHYYFPATGRTFFNVGAGIDFCGIVSAEKRGDFGTIIGSTMTKIDNVHEMNTNGDPMVFVNLRFGMNYYVSGKHFISIEPFYKWKLALEEDVMKTGEKKRWYAGGIILGFNF